MIRFFREMKSRRRVQDRALMSPAVRRAVRHEERNGARFSNRFRYVLFLFLTIPILANTLGSPEDLASLINLGPLAGYLLITIMHSLVLARANDRARRKFDYLVLIADYVLILVANLSWNYVLSPDNFAFALKNSTLLYLFLPLALTVFQFRQKLVWTALFLYASISLGLLVYAYAFEAGVTWTDDWNSYINGPNVVLSDMATAPVVYLFSGLAIWYAIYRSLSMVARIGLAEGQKAVLSRYFAPQVVEEIIAGDENGAAAQSGRRQNVTILFLDIRGFTALSEAMDPDDLLTSLGELREILTRIIFDHGGTLDKFIGDAVMATFGTPHVSPEPGRDSKNAVLCSRAMLRAVDSWNRERAAHDRPPFPIGIGLHAGEVFVGNVGTGNRLEYTVIGDAVNTASRIESLCKTLDWPLIISRSVKDAADHVVPISALPDVVEVKGKTGVLEVYRVLWEQ